MGRLTSRSVLGSMLGAVYGFTLLGMFPLTEAWQLSFLGYAAAALLGLPLFLFTLQFALRLAQHPAAEAGYQEVKVKARDGSIKVRARKGYRFGSHGEG